MSKGNIKHLFPGGNTSQGFFSYYSDIMTQEEADRFMIIKGGPGVGKSTFMKKIGEYMLQKGYDVEYLHCSSDENSLDGVKIPKLRVALIDGTAPHVVDPKNPGAVDEILNFGAFWNDEEIRVHKAEILETNKKISAIFARAYQYFKAAHALYEDSATIYQRALRKEALNQFIKDILAEVLGEGEVAAKEGNLRRLFGSAMSPKGLIHYLDSIITVDQVYEIQGGLGTCEEKILEKVKESALMRGYNVEGYYCALTPQKLEHLVIPDLNLAITTSNAYHASSVVKVRTISMEQFYDMEVLRSYQEDLAQDKMEFNALLGIGLQTISRAKALHDHLETFYVPNIDFEKINVYFDEIIAKILKE